MRNCSNNQRLIAYASRACRAGFTLVELLIVVSILGLLASVAITAADSANAVPTLDAGARILASDLRLARAHAMQYSTNYAVEFDLRKNTYELAHTGAGNLPALENPLLPQLVQTGKYLIDVSNMIPSTQRETGLRIAAVRLESSASNATDVTFGPLGGTGPLRSEDTTIWLEHESARGSEYLPLTVAWVTGQVFLGEPTDIKPTFLGLAR